MVTGHLSEGSFVRNGVVQIPKFDAKPNPNSDSNLNPDPNPSPSPMPMITFRTNDPRTSELSPTAITPHGVCLTVIILRHSGLGGGIRSAECRSS